jgi:hypothetical protein
MIKNVGFILSLTFNVIFWYGFTILSTIFSKKYLNLTKDPHTLTLVTFIYPTACKLLSGNVTKTLKIIRHKVYIYLAFFNIGTILLTNIGMSETTVALTYMVKVRDDTF